MLQCVDDGTGLPTYNNIVLANTTDLSVDPDSWYEHADIAAATWITAGAPIKLRFSNVVPGGLSGNRIEYAGKPAANRLTLHPTVADGIAGTNKRTITSVGTGTATIYPAHVTDYSGQGNHLLFGPNVTDEEVWVDISPTPYMASRSSGSIDGRLGVHTSVAAFNDRFVPWPEFGCLAAGRFKLPEAIVAGGRSWLGNGSPNTSDGFRFQTGSVSQPQEFSFGLRYGGTGADAVTVGPISSPDIEEGVEVHFGVLFDPFEMLGYAWINGRLDVVAQYEALNAVTTVVPTLPFAIGGTAATNCQAMCFRDLSFLIYASRQIHLPTMTDMMRYHASAAYQPFLDGDF